MNFRHVQKSTQRSKSSAQEPILETKVWFLGVQNGPFFNYLFDNFSEWRIYPPLKQEHDFHDFNVRKIHDFSIILSSILMFFPSGLQDSKNNTPKPIFI